MRAAAIKISFCPMRVAIAALVLALGASCASSTPPPKPVPPDPSDETVTALTRWLTLDAAQQKRTRDLLHEMYDRTEKIRAGWSNGRRIRPEELATSRGMFERDFFAILTPEQRQVVTRYKTLLLRGKMPSS